MTTSQPKLPDLADLPYARALVPHEGDDLDPDGTFDTVLFERAEFEAANAPSARFLECAFRQVSITGAKMQRSTLRDVWARDLRLTAVNLAESHWHEVTMIGSALAGAQLFGAELRDVVFSGCKLDSVNFRASRLTGVRFENCVLRDVDFLDASLTKCSFRGSQLTRVDLTRVTMDQTDLRGAELGVIIDTTSLSGAIISTAQLAQAAPVLAETLGIVVEDDQD
jgi:uncharacterized protein YjbI with pentapeptide repeats